MVTAGGDAMGKLMGSALGWLQEQASCPGCKKSQVLLHAWNNERAKLLREIIAAHGENEKLLDEKNSISASLSALKATFSSEKAALLARESKLLAANAKLVEDNAILAASLSVTKDHHQEQRLAFAAEKETLLQALEGAKGDLESSRKEAAELGMELLELKSRLSLEEDAWEERMRKAEQQLVAFAPEKETLLVVLRGELQASHERASALGRELLELKTSVASMRKERNILLTDIKDLMEQAREAEDKVVEWEPLVGQLELQVEKNRTLVEEVAKLRGALGKARGVDAENRRLKQLVDLLENRVKDYKEDVEMLLASQAQMEESRRIQEDISFLEEVEAFCHKCYLSLRDQGRPCNDHPTLGEDSVLEDGQELLH